jgi:hypothetical protein
MQLEQAILGQNLLNLNAKRLGKSATFLYSIYSMET